ncbi:hypothetical protein [Robertkochia aurantiaca]|uniref:hypothetical protein n=1 Tax=Robertkochia aurantiaca TaxID=2873700 RepID=UPI001CCBA02B|nr:hypothetical protein [Robertkochia sp. 3YJGBD-33]
MKLKKFIEYSESLLPHEVRLLERLSQFRDRDREHIFQTVYHNSLSQHAKKEYSANINKRKYSHLMQWMQGKLEENCTDHFYEKLNYLDSRIKADLIDTEEERELLKILKQYQTHHYHFLRFYEVVKDYLNFLLIRVRMNDYKLINDFIHAYHDDYRRGKDINDRLTQCSSDIVNDYHRNILSDQALRWSNWLKKNIQDQQLDGLNRYQSLVLLTYLALMDESLIQETLHFYGEIEEDIINGTYYSRKLLINYYGNKQLLLMKLHKYDLALHYGELSTNIDGPDYVMYLTNYAFNLMRLGKTEKALEIMQNALPSIKNMSNRYNRTLFISSMIRGYNENKAYERSKRYAENQLQLYEKDILEHNWHRFFRNYFESLVHLRDYQTLRKVLKKYNLLERENFLLTQFTGYPYFNWFSKLIKYKQGSITEKRFMGDIRKEIEKLTETYGVEPSSSIVKLMDKAIYELV